LSTGAGAFGWKQKAVLDFQGENLSTPLNAAAEEKPSFAMIFAMIL
jgi:hypothetical protein